jgi:hypothetical protein
VGDRQEELRWYDAVVCDETVITVIADDLRARPP